MEIIKEFGVNPVLLIAQIINFLIILYLLKRFLYKPILTTLDNRRNQIKESLKQAEEAKLLLRQAEEREKEMLRHAQEEAKKLLEETRNQRNQIMAEAEQAAKSQTKKIITEAKKQIEIDTKEVQRKLTLEASSLLAVYLHKSIAQMFSVEDQKSIVEYAVEQIKRRA